MQIDKSRNEGIKEEARRAKAIAVEKYKSGDFAGSKEFAVKARELNPKLCGLKRLNTVLDVRMAFEKKVNGKVDYYALFSVDPTVDLGTIAQRYIRLCGNIVHDNDNSVGSIVEANAILIDAFRYLKEEKTKEVLAKRREQIRNQLCRRSYGGNKRKEPPNTDQSSSVENNTSVIKPSLGSCVSASQDKNVSAYVESKTLEDSTNNDAAKRVKVDESKNNHHMPIEEEPNVVINEGLNHILVTNVPDSDFYDFDKDRTEASFGENQVWAAYDDSDGMPRYYALVHKVVSQEPFKLCVSWLMCKNNKELGPMKWVDCEYYKTSGCFSTGKREYIDTLNSFSHRIELKKRSRGLLHIYPKKGSVWALYNNWSPSWGLLTSEEVIYVYEMVEVLQDFEEDEGVTVVPLVKVPGFRTVFRRHPNLIKTFPKKELFRFSHQVASHLLTSNEGNNAHEGCLELDPAALSPELLKVLH